MELSSSSSGSSKRARAPNNGGTQGASCLVDGCNSDLSKCRDYHRRHKVCEVHSKTPKVTILGQEQRFCQQCSRFHSLDEFDEGKRSCRKRLDGHNRRRRKPQPESLSLNSGRFLSTHQGPRFLPFSSPQIFPTTSVVSSGWDSAVKVPNDPMHYNTHPQLNFIDRKDSFLGSFSQSYGGGGGGGGGKQFPFLTTAVSAHTESSSVCQPLSDSLKNGGGSSRKLFSDGSNRVVNNNNNSGCALSLLSTPSTESSRDIGLTRMVIPHDSNPQTQQSLFSRAQHYNNSSGLDGMQIGSSLTADGSSSSTSNIYCQGMFQIEHDGSSPNGSQQTISFSWE